MVIEDGAKDNKEHKVDLFGIEFSFKALNVMAANNDSMQITLNNVVEEDVDGVKLQVGANQDQMIDLNIENMRSRELGLGGIEVGTVEDAQEAI